MWTTPPRHDRMIDMRQIYEVRKFPSVFHAVWLVLGFLSCGILWVGWLIHFFLYYTLITEPDKRKAKQERAEWNAWNTSATSTEGNESDDQSESRT